MNGTFRRLTRRDFPATSMMAGAYAFLSGGITSAYGIEASKPALKKRPAR